jgi:hypothetical protein
MGPFVIVALIAVVASLGWRGVRKEHKRVVETLKDAEASLDKRAPVTLEKDPDTGVYRAPRRRG